MQINAPSGHAYRTTEQSWRYREATLHAGIDVSSLAPVSIVLPPAGDLDDTACIAQAQAIAAIRHRSLHRILDAGLSDEQEPAIILQRLEGVSLQRIIANQRATMEELLALLVVRTVAQALTPLHAAELEHGHICPACIRLLGNQQIHLAYTLPAALRPALIGTEPWPVNIFRPPEGGPIIANHDLYALGMIALCALCPSLMDEESQDEITACRRDGPAELLSQRPAISEGTRQFLTCACAADPGRRYNTAEQLATDATDVIAGQQARHAQERSQQRTSSDDEGRRSDVFNTADIQAHLAKSRPGAADAEQNRGSAMVAAIDKEMLAVVARLVVVSKDQMRASINLAPGTAFPRELLTAVLDQAGVVHGRIEANILKATSPSDTVRRLEIARGVPPAPGRPGITVLGRETMPLLQDATVEISTDGMEAWILSIPDQAVPAERVTTVAREAGIQVPLLREALDQLAQHGDPQGRCLIARGEAPHHAIASQFIPSRHEILEQEAIDQFIAQGAIQRPEDEQAVRMVRAGECLAVWRQGTHPRDGHTVTGATIPARGVTHLNAAGCAGEGTELQRNKRKLVFLRARHPGAMQILEDGTVRVVGVSQMTAAAAAKDGLIESDDLLVIDGDINDGMVVHANGGLIVHGDVGDAELHIGGDCTIDGRLRAGSREIQCAGHLRCGSIERRSLVAAEVTIAGAIRDCDIVSLGAVTADCAIGGSITAAGSIVVRELGSENGEPTACWAGHHVPKAVQRTMAKLDEKRLHNERRHMIQERDEMREMVESIARTQYRFNIGGWMGKEYLVQMRDRINRIRLRSSCIDDSLERARSMIVDKVEEIVAIRDEADNTRAFIQAERAHPQVTVKLADAETRTFDHGQDDLDFHMHE